MASDDEHRSLLAKTAALVGVSTVLLTASFVGMLGFLTGEITGVGSRLPVYSVIAGLSFAVAILLLEEHRKQGGAILMSAVMFALIAFAVVTLTVEGLVFAFQSPERVFVSQLIYYFVAAALIGTGIGYWMIRHWREFTSRATDGL